MGPISLTCWWDAPGGAGCCEWLAELSMGDVVGGKAIASALLARRFVCLRFSVPALLSPQCPRISKMKRGGTVKKIGGFFFFAGMFLILSTVVQPVEAQTLTTGTVIGTVTDPSGAAVLDATVVPRNKTSNSQATQKTKPGRHNTLESRAPSA